jgi:putative intracellular protease/amidase
MFDLADDATSHRLINEFYAADRVVSAVCHGPAALARVKLAGDGRFLLWGEPVTGFSNVEEDQVGMTPFMPFLLEDALNEASGGKYEKAKEPWAEKVVVARGGKLITGQNPASAAGVGKAIWESLSGKA